MTDEHDNVTTEPWLGRLLQEAEALQKIENQEVKEERRFVVLSADDYLLTLQIITPLLPDAYAMIYIERAYVYDRAEGNQVSVAGHLVLPAAADGILRHELQFGNIQHFSPGNELGPSWGSPVMADGIIPLPEAARSLKWRHRFDLLTGKSWHVAFLRAELHLKRMLNSLQEALKLREEFESKLEKAFGPEQVVILLHDYRYATEKAQLLKNYDFSNPPPHLSIVRSEHRATQPKDKEEKDKEEK